MIEQIQKINMHYKILIFYLFLVLVSCSSNKNINILGEEQESIIEEVYYGDTIVDKYRFYENLQDNRVIEYLKAQDELAENYFNKINNSKLLKNEIIDYNYKSEFLIQKVKIISDAQWVYLKKVSTDSLFNVYTFNPTKSIESLVYKTNNKIYDTYPSPDGSFIVIAESYSDGDFATLKIFDLKSNSFLREEFKNAFPRFGSINWIGDHSFSYQFFPNIEVNSTDYTNNSESRLVTINKNGKTETTTLFSSDSHETINPEDRVYVLPSVNGEFLVGIVVSNNDYTRAFLSIGATLEWKPLWSQEDKINSVRISNNSLYYTKYDKDKKLALYKTSLESPEFSSPITILKEENWVLGDFVITADGIFYTKLFNGVEAELGYISKSGNGIFDLPRNPGRITLNTKNPQSSFLWLEVDSWVNSKELFIANFDKKSVNKFITNDDGLNTDDYIIKEIEIESYDGEMVPLSLIYKKSINISNNTSPVLLFAYGAFGISLRPYKYKFLLPWIENGGIYAVAHVRGGGEKGKKWVEGGKGTKKFNTWKDFISASEYLIENKYCDPSKIVSWSSSAGAICIGRALIEKPELYAGAIILNGQLNPIRGEFEPGGKISVQEYGTVETKEGFESLLNMDAYHNLKKNIEYPPVYLRTALNDTRVPAYHSAKFHARLKELNENATSILDMDFGGGHGLLLTQEKRIEETFKILAFAYSCTENTKYSNSN